MTEVDTSSYPKAQITNPLDNVQKMGNIVQQQVGIEKSKLDLMNQRYGIMNRELSTLIDDPNLDWSKIQAVGQNAVKQGLITPQMWAQQVSQFAGKMQDPNALRGTLQQVLSRNMTTQEAVNWHYGQPGIMQTGNAQIPIVQSPRFGMRQTGAPIPDALTPQNLAEPVTITDTNRDSPTYGQNITVTRQQFLQMQGQGVNPAGEVPQITPGARPAIAPAGPQNPLGGVSSAPQPPRPQRNALGATGAPKPSVAAPTVAPAPKVATPTGVATGLAPGDAENMQAQVKEYTDAQTRSGKYPNEITPLMSAHKVLKDMKPGETGVSRETVNRWKNAAVALGLPVGKDMEKDAAEFEKFAKATAQMANETNPGSDERLRSAYSAGPATDKTREANMYLTTQLISLRNLQQAADLNVQKLVDNKTITQQRAKDQIVKFKNSQDPVAYGFTTMPRQTQDAYIKSLTNDEKVKFARSLKTAKELGIIGTPQ